jgi:flagellar protein FliS
LERFSRDSYLATEVLTATPQKLHLMLVEAAIRFAQRGRRQWQAGDDAAACESLVRAQNIVSQLMSGLNYDSGCEVVPRLAAIYQFVFRTLLDGNLRRSEQKIDDAIRVLEAERETWRQVCEKYPGNSAGSGDSLTQFDQGGAAPPLPHDLGLGLPAADGLPTSGFSLEA